MRQLAAQRSACSAMPVYGLPYLPVFTGEQLPAGQRRQVFRDRYLATNVRGVRRFPWRELHVTRWLDQLCLGVGEH